MNKRVVERVMFLVIIVAVSGCATVFNQKSEPVYFTSDPTGAAVYLHGDRIGKTPTETRLQASESHRIRFAKEGYEEKTVLLNYHVGIGWVCLGFFTAIIPIVVDLATQSWYELDDNEIHAVLRKKPS